MTLSPDWTKSSLSHVNGNCLEARATSGGVDVRNSRDRKGPVLRLTPGTWSNFLADVRNGAFDLPS